jgi:hypothetical protein
VSDVKILPDIQQLSAITEAVNTTFTITAEEEDGVLLQQELPITLLAYDEWAGPNVMPEHLAAFVVERLICIPVPQKVVVLLRVDTISDCASEVLLDRPLALALFEQIHPSGCVVYHNATVVLVHALLSRLDYLCRGRRLYGHYRKHHDNQ